MDIDRNNDVDHQHKIGAFNKNSDLLKFNYSHFKLGISSRHEYYT